MLNYSMRVFIALPLPDAFKSALIAGTAGIRASSNDLRWIPAENIHLTLAFLGELDNAGADLAIEAAQKAARMASAFQIKADGLLSFPPGGRVNILAARITEGSKECAELADRIETTLEYFGRADLYQFREREKRPFTAHLTIARAGRGGSAMTRNQLRIPLNAVGSISSIAVYQSILERGGAKYRELRRLPFIP